MKKKQINTRIESLLIYFFTKELKSGFRDKQRHFQNVRDRRLICKFLNEKGFNKKQIARVIGQKNHSLVFHLLREVIDKSFDEYYTEKIGILEDKFINFCQENKIICKNTQKSI